jgi:hypothetical protein
VDCGWTFWQQYSKLRQVKFKFLKSLFQSKHYTQKLEFGIARYLLQVEPGIPPRIPIALPFPQAQSHYPQYPLHQSGAGLKGFLDHFQSVISQSFCHSRDYHDYIVHIMYIFALTWSQHNLQSEDSMGW